MERLTDQIQNEVNRVILGKEDVVRKVLLAALAGGHVLLEDVPGVGKTTMAMAFAKTLGLETRRVQFTSDTLPSDIIGFSVYDRQTEQLHYQPGAVMTNLLLADEINRTSSKTQSALLEAMEERQVTLGEDSFPLPSPFLVLATQNPLEQEGTFPLPEAQMDRFLFKLKVDYPAHAEEVEVLRRADGHEEAVRPVLDEAAVLHAGHLAAQVRLDEAIRDYIVRLVGATRAGHGKAWKGKELLRCGASPRAGLALQAASKALALVSGRDHVLPDDVVTLAPDVLRHRLLLTYEAEADGVSTDEVIRTLLGAVPRP